MDEGGRRLRSPWRVGFFAVVMVVLAVVGYVLHVKAADTFGVPEDHRAPLNIGVYASDPSAPVSVFFDVQRAIYEDGVGRVTASLTVYSPKSVKVLLTSDHGPYQQSKDFVIWKRGDPMIGGTAYYAVLDPSQRKLNDGGGYNEGDFVLPSDSLSRDAYEIGPGDSIYINAPDVAPNETPVLAENQYATTESPNGKIPQLFQGQFQIGDDPSKDGGVDSAFPGVPIIDAIPGRKITDLFYEPQRLLTTEQVGDLGSSSNYDIQSAAPSNFKESDGFYTWTTTGGVHPTFTALKRGLADQGSSLDFLSGVAFATAAAALVALAQELPERWRRRRIRSSRTGVGGKSLDDRGWVDQA